MTYRLKVLILINKSDSNIGKNKSISKNILDFE